MERQQKVKPTKSNTANHNNFEPKASAHKLTPLHPVLQLQQKIGNQAVQPPLSSGGIQGKMKIGQLKDQYEKEADRVAAPVMRIPPLSRNGMASSRRAESLQTQRACPECEEELQRKAKAGYQEGKPFPGKLESVQSQRAEDEESLQGKLNTSETPTQFQDHASEAKNRRGIPNPLKAGLEALWHESLGHTSP
jgi:hypothetical protein